MRTTPEETERNNQIILDTAIRLFSQKGYNAVNIQDIADEIGITKGPLYYRYKSKAKLFEAALEKMAKEQVQEYERIFTQDKSFFVLVREDLQYCMKDYAFTQYTFDDIAMLEEELADARIIMKECTQAIYVIKEKAVKKAMEQGELKEGTDPRHVVNLMFVYALGIHETLHKQNMIKTQEEIDECIDDYVYLLKHKYGN